MESLIACKKLLFSSCRKGGYKVTNRYQIVFNSPLFHLVALWAVARTNFVLYLRLLDPFLHKAVLNVALELQEEREIASSQEGYVFLLCLHLTQFPFFRRQPF